MSLHPFIVLTLTICLGMAIAAFGFIGWMVWKDRKAEKERRKETDRMISAFEALLDQDSEVIRKLMRP